MGRKKKEVGEAAKAKDPVLSCRPDVHALLMSGSLQWKSPRNDLFTLNWTSIYGTAELLPATGSSIVNNKTCAPLGALWTLLQGEPCPLEFPRIIHAFGIPWAFGEGFWRGWDYGAQDQPIERHYMALEGLKLPGENIQLLELGAKAGLRARTEFPQEIPHLPYDRTPYRRKS